MQYLLMLTFRPGEGPEEGTPGFDAEMDRWEAVKRELREAGALVGGTGLQRRRGDDGAGARTASWS